MKREWIYIEPTDQATAKMLDFILSCCQTVRAYTTVREYLRDDPFASIVPTYTLQEAIKTEDTQGFMIPPREGWAKEDVQTLSSYGYANKITADKANQELFLDKKISFLWGSIVLQSGFKAMLEKQTNRKLEWFSEYKILAHIKQIEFRVANSKQQREGRKWKIQLHLK